VLKYPSGEFGNMEMTGEQLIPLPQQRVWEALNDPEILRACIPGCESIERVTDTEYKVAMTAAVGPVKAKFSGKLSLADLNPPESYALSFDGSGGAAGFGKGTAKVTLQPDGSGTRLAYSVNASVGGKLAQIGSRLIDGVARKMAEEFFVRFNQTVAPPATQASDAESDSETGSRTTPTLRIWGWVATGLIVTLLLYMGWTR
jgi:carbon monoxide dehydrogenase subunit G